MEKKEARKRALEKRDRMPEKLREEKSLRITEIICNLKCYSEASALLIYRSFRTEVNTSHLIERAWEARKRVFCPRVEGKDMNFYEVSGWEDFQRGSYGIMEPVEICPVFEGQKEKPLVILPGAAFDKKRHRVGYGGGFYDRFLARNIELSTVAVGFDEQIVEEMISAELFDIRPQKIVTDLRCFGVERCENLC